MQAGISGLGTLVSLSKLKLDKIAIKGDKVTTGAATTLAAIGEERGLAFLHPAIESVGSPTLRNLATIGGNLFTEQPYGDVAVCLLALDAEAGRSDQAWRAPDFRGRDPEEGRCPRRDRDRDQLQEAREGQLVLSQGDATRGQLGLDRHHRRGICR